MKIEIRKATLEHLDFLVAANAAMAWETECKRLDPDTLRAGIISVFEVPARGHYYVAESAAGTLGCLLITHEWSDWRNGDWWWIQSVYVAPEARQQGVFRALYERIEAEARATSGVIGLRLYVEQENDKAQRTYRALGMRAEHYHMYAKGFVA